MDQNINLLLISFQYQGSHNLANSMRTMHQLYDPSQIQDQLPQLPTNHHQITNSQCMSSLVSHFLDSIHPRSRGVSDEALPHLSTRVIILPYRQVHLLPQEIVEILRLHLRQLLVLSQVLLIVLPILLVVVLPSQLPLVDCKKRPSANVSKSALLQNIQVGVLDGDALGVETGDDGVAQRRLVEGFGGAEDGALADGLDEEGDEEGIAVGSRLADQVLKQLLAVFIPFLQTHLHFPPHPALPCEVHLLPDGDLALSHHEHVVGSFSLTGQSFSGAESPQLSLSSQFAELFEAELAEEGYFEQFGADIVSLCCFYCLPGAFDPDVVDLEQFDAVDGGEVSESFVEVEDQPVADRQLDELLLLDRVDLLLDLALPQDYHQRVRLQNLTQVRGDQRTRLVLHVFQRGYLPQGTDVEGVQLVQHGQCLFLWHFVLQTQQVLDLESKPLIFNGDRWVHRPDLYNFIMESKQFTPSPNKRSTFRSKTKLKELASTMESKLKAMPSFYVYIKDFPLDIPEDVINLVKTLQPTHNTFVEHLDNLKLYKPQLAALLEDSWVDSMQILKAVIAKLSKRNEKAIEEKERKINELLRMNRELEKEQQKWSEKVEKLEHLRELESAQLSMADTELEMVNGEMRDIYKLLQGDMQKVANYLTRLQSRRAQQEEEGSDQINASVKTLSLLLSSMENEQRSAGSTLGNMRELIKSMTKCSKVTTGTQVDESELLTQAGAIFSIPQTNQIPFHEADASAINVPNSSQGHLIDQLKFKERFQPHQNFSQAKHAQKPWALTPTLLAFLENMSKENEAGKVLPWQYTKQLMKDICSDRIALEAQLMTGGVGNGMQFDEFVVFYFLRKHRIRRLAEIKLLEFIISLKYYSRYWVRAELFCQLMEVMRYQPLFDQAEGFNYRFDYNTQNFFFSIYRKMSTFDCVEEEGTTYVEKKSAKKLLKISLYFTEEYQRSRLLAKLDKDLRVFDKEEYCDFDWAIALMIDEYFAAKRRISIALNRAFAKKFQQNQGYFSIDELKDIFTETASIYRAVQSVQYSFPLSSDIQLGKLYLYTCTSGKNTYDLNVNNFITACQRYGFDAPFPFLHSCKSKKHKEETHEEKSVDTAKVSPEEKKSRLPSANLKKQVEEAENVEAKPLESSLNKERIDIQVKLFSQHFSILRELRTYVDIFTKTLKEEKNADVVWKSFDQIKQVLQRGCEFMKYPLHDSRK